MTVCDVMSVAEQEWHGYNEVSGMSCGMVSYFDRILEKQ